MSKTKDIFLPSPVDWVDREFVVAEDGVINLDAMAEMDLYTLLRLKEKVEQCIEIAKNTIARKCIGNEKYSADSTRVNISFIPARKELKFRSSEFRKDYPDLYKKYCFETEIKPQVKMSAKEIKTSLSSFVYVDSDGVVHGLEEEAEAKKREEGDLEVTTNSNVGAEDGE